MNLDQHLDVKATRIPNNRCIEVKWKKIESGACYVKYDIEFKNESGNHLLYYETGYNIGEIKPCNLTEYDYITKVVLRISFNYSSNNFTTKVLDYLASNTKVIGKYIYFILLFSHFFMIKCAIWFLSFPFIFGSSYEPLSSLSPNSLQYLEFHSIPTDNILNWSFLNFIKDIST